jgi:hypothetical protein
MLTWVSILRLLKCLTLTLDAKTILGSQLFALAPLIDERAGSGAHASFAACSRRLLKYTSVRAQSSIAALSWSMSAWAGGMRGRAPGWRAWRATGPCRWPSRGTRPLRFRRRSHQRKHHYNYVNNRYLRTGCWRHTQHRWCR